MKREMMEKVIAFDMDGTIADLYNVNNWLEQLREEKVNWLPVETLGKPSSSTLLLRSQLKQQQSALNELISHFMSFQTLLDVSLFAGAFRDFPG